MKTSEEYEASGEKLPIKLKLHENVEMNDLQKQSFLSPSMSTDYSYTNLKKECKEKISSLLSLKSGPGSPNVSPWSDTSDTSVFTFPGSDVSPAGLSPLLQRKATLGCRPISPLVSSAYNKYNRNHGTSLILSPQTIYRNISFTDKVGKVDPKLYRSISLDSYDFTTLSEDFMGKIYFQVRPIQSDLCCLKIVWFKY